MGYTLKTPYRDGTTQVVFESLDFMARVFKLDLESWAGCGGQVRVIACIDDPAVIGKILAHVERQVPSSVSPILLPPARGPPGQGLQELS